MDIRRSNTRCPEHDLHVLQIGIHGATGETSVSPHLFPVIHEDGGSVGPVVQEAAAADGRRGAEEEG